MTLSNLMENPMVGHDPLNNPEGERMNIQNQAEAVAKAADELSQRCKAALATIDAAEARRVEAHKRHVAAIDALLDMLGSSQSSKTVSPK
jgi:CRISPR/Cas system-associated protein Cas7 (RAMP superfamily)